MLLDAAAAPDQRGGALTRVPAELYKAESYSAVGSDGASRLRGETWV